jgi:hypothetical protein
MVRLTLLDFAASLLSDFPTIIAFITTVTFDKTTPILEWVAHRWAHGGQHNIVLLILFALQVLILTPFVSRLSDKMCWSSFGKTLDAVRSLFSEMRTVDAQIGIVEQQIADLPSKHPAAN